ncbi:MAG: enoyl-CoA hydratase/isomerase family protein [Thermoanaerobaculia bacterium]
MIVFHPRQLAAADRAMLDSIVARSQAVVAIGDGELRGFAAASALHSDWFALSEGGAISLDEIHSWSGAVWRIGRKAVRLLLHGAEPIDASDALGYGLVDAVVPRGRDSVQWLEEWMRGRSGLAIDSAAALIRRRGGDPLERAEFARMFSIGEPQVGLSAFLAKRKPEFEL